jgi:hypothetical protein
MRELILGLPVKESTDAEFVAGAVASASSLGGDAVVCGAAIDLARATGVCVFVSTTGRSGGRLKSFGADTWSRSESVAAVADASSLESDAIVWGVPIDLAAATAVRVCGSTTGRSGEGVPTGGSNRLSPVLGRDQSRGGALWREA